MPWFKAGAVAILSFVVAVVRHWVGLIGGTVIGAAYLVLASQGRDVPQSVAKGFLYAGLPLAVFLAWREQYREVKRLTRKARLELRFRPAAPYVSERRTRVYLVGIYNHGPGVADNVQVTLTSLDPRPRYPAYQGRFPWSLGLPIGESIATPQAGYVPGRAINENEEMYFEFAEAWRSSDDRLMIAGLDGVDVRGAGLQSFRNCAMGDDERWRLRIAVSSANAVGQTATLAIVPDGDRLNITLQLEDKASA